MQRTALIITALALAPCVHASLASMIPSPQQVEALGWSAPVAGGRIVLCSDDPKAQIAADEINARIVELGGEALEVSRPAPDGNVRGLVGPWIMLGTADAAANWPWPGAQELGISAEDPGPQGYVIRSTNEGGNMPDFVLAGSDAQGMLYAAVTFREMLDVEYGQVVIRAAHVRDWPDFRLRQLGDPFTEPLRTYYYQVREAGRAGDLERARALGDQHVALMQTYIDWLLHHKINMMGPLMPAEEDYSVVSAAEREVQKRVTDYARARGITAELRANIAIGTYPRDADNPDLADVVYHAAHQRYFCWSRLQYHRAKAQAIAEVMRDCGIAALYLHDVDGGGWRDPALWDQRCARCRETYGDDHARADAVVFGIYYDAVRAAVPDAIFSAVIYPYNPNAIDPDAIEAALRAEMGDVPGVREIAERYANRNRAMLERLNSLVPDDWHICIRENERVRVDLFRAVWDPKPFYTYFEYMRYRSVQQWFATSPRWTATFLYPGYDDILYGSIPGWGFREPLRLYAAQAAWNSAGADPAPFDSGAWNDWRQTQQPTEIAEKWALRASADLWGEDVAPFMLPLFTRNLSPELIFNTDEVVDRASIADPTAALGEQYEVAGACVESMDALFDRILAGEITPKPQWFGDLTDYYRLVVAARALAGFKHQRALLEEAVIAGDAEAEARLLAELGANINTWRADIERVQERTAGLPIAQSSSRLTVAKGYLLALSGEVLREQLDEFLARREELAAAYAMPRWFADFIANRDYQATRAEAPVTIDGRLDEEVWARAEPIEHFVVYNALRLAAYETVARLAWDPQALYVAFECFDPAPEQLQIAPRQRDRHEQVDSVEVLVDANRDRETFRHLIVDLGGNLFDAARSKRPDGTLVYQSAWDGHEQVAVERLADRFVVEIAIPAEDLDRAPGDGPWGIHLARNLLHGRPGYESVEARYLDGEGFHAVAKFGALSFAGPESRVRPPRVTVETTERSLQTKVHEEGQATEVRFGLRIETDRSLHHVAATARLLDPAGEPVAEQVVLERPWIELLERTRRPLFLEVKRAYEGLLLEVTVRAEEGSWSTRAPVGAYRAAPPDAAEMFAPGIDGQALAATMVAPSIVEAEGGPVQLVRSAQGTIEAWLCPTADVVADRERGAQRTIIDIGPIRYDYPYLTNWRSIALHINAHAQLVFQITSERYDSRAVQASVDGWSAGQWRHVACQWVLDDGGRCRLQLFIDGRLACDRVTGKSEGDVAPALQKQDEMLPLQVGAMNTGTAPAHVLVDELRVSLQPRYHGDFEPRRRLQADAETSLLLRFDGDLSAESGLPGVVVTGQAGTAG
ncbi:MAG: glycoside hydrolase family 20 zincin-like fold domain-containing protein [Armatimonadota bacterium]